jgi:hypothetical protein
MGTSTVTSIIAVDAICSTLVQSYYCKLTKK